MAFFKGFPGVTPPPPQTPYVADRGQQRRCTVTDPEQRSVLAHVFSAFVGFLEVCMRVFTSMGAAVCMCGCDPAVESAQPLSCADKLKSVTPMPRTSEDSNSGPSRSSKDTKSQPSLVPDAKQHQIPGVESDAEVETSGMHFSGLWFGQVRLGPASQAFSPSER